MPSPLLIGILGILFLFLLMAARMQIGFTLALVGFIGFVLINSFESGFSILGMEAFKTGSSYSLSVIPLFILMGQFSNHSRMGSDIYKMVYRWVGFLPGGLAMATIGACACFAAISGSSLATSATMGMVALPEMKKFKYADSLATGCIAAGGTLGILIPPSTVLIIYGILTETAIGPLFIAGIVPGILLSALFIITIYMLVRFKPDVASTGTKFTFSEKMVALKDTWGILSLFLLVVGGLYTGWFTPTEAAGVGAFGALVITLIKRRLTRGNLIMSLKETAGTTGMIFAILIGAGIFQYFLTISRIPNELTEMIVNMGMNRYAVISFIILSFIVLGCFMEGLSIMILAVPLVFPIVMELGFDAIWFGIIITLVMEMSLITPPVGVNVFILSGVAKDVPMYTIFKGIFPFWIAMLICIILLILFPQIALFLPGTMSN